MLWELRRPDEHNYQMQGAEFFKNVAVMTVHIQLAANRIQGLAEVIRNIWNCLERVNGSVI